MVDGDGKVVAQRTEPVMMDGGIDKDATMRSSLELENDHRFSGDREEVVMFKSEGM